MYQIFHCQFNPRKIVVNNVFSALYNIVHDVTYVEVKQ